MGGMKTWPPLAATADAVASASSERRYVDQASVMPAWSSSFCMSPATVLPFLRAVV